MKEFLEYLQTRQKWYEMQAENFKNIKYEEKHYESNHRMSTEYKYLIMKFEHFMKKN